mgnify:CR=1 FL=1
MIQAFRGIGKSFLTCAYVVWRLWKDPQKRVLIVSKSEESAKESASLIRQIIYHEAGDDLWAELRTQPNQRNSVLSFDVGPALADKQPSVKALGIGGQLPGNRADIIIPDDIEVLSNSDTEHARQKLIGQATEFEAILKTTPDAEITYLGTPQTVMSVYTKLPSKGYDVRVWPARYPSKDKLPRYAKTLAPMLALDLEKNPGLSDMRGTESGGAPTDTRFDDLDLIRREAGMQSAKFALQYMLDTALSDADRYPLKTRDLIVMNVGKTIAHVGLEWGNGGDLTINTLANVGLDGDTFNRPFMVTDGKTAAYTGSVMTIDPSGQGKDETAYCVTKFLNGMVYVRRWGGFVDGFGPATLEELAKIAKEEEVNEIEVETNYDGGMFINLLQPVVNRHRPCRVTGKRVSGRKEERILNALEPAMKQHRLVIDMGVIEQDQKEENVEYRGLFQMTRLNSSPGALSHDDRIDALASSVIYWTDYMKADNRKAIEAHDKKAWREDERKRWAGTPLAAAMAKKNPLARGQGRPLRR